MNELIDATPYSIKASLLAIILAAGTYLLTSKTARKQPSDVRVIWYLYFLALTATLIAAHWGASVGAIDGNGNFHGEFGAIISSALKFMLNLNHDVAAFVAIWTLILVPQLAGYLVSGLFGCASAPILVSQSFSFLAWGIAKSFVSAGGVIMGVAIYGNALEWKGWDLRGASSLGAMSLTLICVATYVLYIYRDISEGVEDKEIKYSIEYFHKIKKWMSRNVPDNA